MRGRLALVVAVSVLGGLTLSACQRDPDVAARADGKVLTEDQVDTIYADALRDVPVPLAGSTEKNPISRQDVVVAFVVSTACAKKQVAEGFPITEYAPADVAEALGVAPASQYTQYATSMYGCIDGLINSQPPPQPTTAELQQVFKAAEDAGLLRAGVKFADVEAGLAGDQGVQRSVALKRAVDGLVSGADVEVNPRYAPISLPWASLEGVPAGLFSTIGPAGSDAIKH